MISSFTFSSLKEQEEKVKRVIAEHVVNGQVVTEYTIGAAQ